MPFSLLSSIGRVFTSNRPSTISAPSPFIWFKFNSEDVSGSTIFDHGVYNNYVGTLSTTTNIINTSTFKFGSGSLNCNNTNYLSINLTTAYGNALSNYGISSSSGFVPNFKGYSFTIWVYYFGSGGFATFILGSPVTITFYPGDRFSFGQSNYNPYYSYISSFVKTNTWTFLAMTFPAGSDKSNLKPTVYQYDSSSYQSALVTPQSGTGGTLSGNSTSPLNVGFTSGAQYISNAYMNGYIDDFRIYNTELTSSQILDIYNGKM